MRISICVIIVILLFSAELTTAQIFGVKAGGHLSIMNVITDEYTVPYNTIRSTYGISQGYHIGGTIEYGILKHLTVETGLSLSTKSLKFTEDEQSFGNSLLTSEGKTDLYYVELPLNLVIPFRVDGLNFFGSAGPYAGYGLYGKKMSTHTFDELSEKSSENVRWGSDPGVSDFRKFDYGVSVGTGIDIQSMQLGISYTLGLRNLSPKSDYGSKINHQLIGVFLAYKFGKGRVQAQEKPMSENNKEKPEKSIPERSGRKETAREEERLRLEQMKADSISAVKASEEIARIEKMRNESSAAENRRKEQLEAEKMRIAKLKTDSIELATRSIKAKPVEVSIVYRIQFASNTKPVGSKNIQIGGKDYTTWEYMYSGAYRSTVGEFKTFSEASRFQAAVRNAGYAQAFVVAFKNNVRVTDPALFK